MQSPRYTFNCGDLQWYVVYVEDRRCTNLRKFTEGRSVRSRIALKDDIWPKLQKRLGATMHGRTTWLPFCELSFFLNNNIQERGFITNNHFDLRICANFKYLYFYFKFWQGCRQGGITCGAINEPRKSSKAIDERVSINFCDKNVVIARFRNKNEAFILLL